MIGFCVSGVVHLLAAGSSTRVFAIPLEAEFGLLQLLPAGYWVGLGLIGFALVLAVREGSAALVALSGSILLGSFAGTAGLFEPNPRYWDTYLHFGETQALLASGRLPSADFQYSANWPGFFLVAGSLSASLGLPAMEFLKWFPFVSGALTFLAIFIFLRSTFPPSVVAPGAVLGSLFAVWAQYHLSPQSLGFVLLLLVLALLRRREPQWRIAGAIVFGGLVVSHPTSTLLLLSVLITASTFGLLWGRRSGKGREDARFLRRVTAVYAATWFAWLFLHATGSSRAAQTAILARMGALINLPENTLNLATARATENLFVYAPLLRLGSLALYAGLALLALVLLRRNERLRPLARFLLASLFGLGLIAGADILAFGGQFYDRCLLLFAVLAPALCLTGLREVRLPRLPHRTILAILVGASLASASTAFYQEAFNHVSDSSVRAGDFLQRIPSGSVVFDGMFPVPVWRDTDDRVSYARVPFYQVYNGSLSEAGAGFSTYAVFDPTAELWYEQWRGIDIYRLYEDEVANHTLVYDNGHARVYYVEA